MSGARSRGSAAGRCLRACWVLALLAAGLLTTACRNEQPHRESKRRGKAERVASRTVAADELLWELGPKVRDKVVAVSPMADDRRYSLVADQWPESVPRLGRNPEELLALAPELVILASFSDSQYRRAIERKLDVLILDDFTGYAGYLDAIERVGEAVGAKPEARALRERFETRRRELDARRPPAHERPTVVGWDHEHVPGSDTSFNDAATTAGFRNYPAGRGVVGHQRIDVEQIVAWNPDWLVIACGERPCAEAEAELGERPGIGKMDAVRAGRVIAIEAPYLGTVGAGMLDLAERMQLRLLAERDG